MTLPVVIEMVRAVLPTRRHTRSSLAIILALGLFSSSCSFDSNTDAPFAAPANQPGACGTTEALFPKLFEFTDRGGFRPLRTVLERRLATNAESPQPDAPLRVVLNAVLRLVRQLGLDRTLAVARVASKADFEQQVAPIISTLLRFMAGQVDGIDHYDAAEAAGHFVAVCDPEHLLRASELVLRYQSPSAGKPWIVAVFESALVLVEDPELQPFLDTFQNNAEEGKPAIIALLAQVMSFMTDDEFAISRVETLLDSAVYPAVTPAMADKIRALVMLLDEATRPEAGMFVALQGAMRCGMQHEPQRDALLGLAYDLLASPEVEVRMIISAAGEVLESDSLLAELSLFADLILIVREDLTIRDDLRHLLTVLLSRPEVAEVLPVFIELIDEGVVAELLEAIIVIVDGC